MNFRVSALSLVAAPLLLPAYSVYLFHLLLYTYSIHMTKSLVVQTLSVLAKNLGYFYLGGQLSLCLNF